MRTTSCGDFCDGRRIFELVWYIEIAIEIVTRVDIDVKNSSASHVCRKVLLEYSQSRDFM